MASPRDEIFIALIAHVEVQNGRPTHFVAPELTGYGVSDAVVALLCAWTIYEIATTPVTVAEARVALRKARRAAALAVHARDQIAAGLRNAVVAVEGASVTLHRAAGHEGEWQACAQAACSEDRAAVAETRSLVADLTRDDPALS